jgi:hypothetical protein
MTLYKTSETESMRLLEQLENERYCAICLLIHGGKRRGVGKWFPGSRWRCPQGMTNWAHLRAAIIVTLKFYDHPDGTPGSESLRRPQDVIV